MRLTLLLICAVILFPGCTQSTDPDSVEPSISVAEHERALSEAISKQEAAEAKVVEIEASLAEADERIESLLAQTVEQDQRFENLMAQVENLKQATADRDAAQARVDEERERRRKLEEIGRLDEEEFAEFESLIEHKESGKELNRNELRRLEELAPLTTRDYVRQEYAERGESLLKSIFGDEGDQPEE